MTRTARKRPEWVGKTPDTAAPSWVKDRILMAQDDRCAECRNDFCAQLRPEFDHITALINLGENRESKGLLVKGQLNMGVQRAREAYELLKAGDIDGLSIGYRIRGYEVDEEKSTWTLTKLDLHEVSIVSIGANESATIEAVKSGRLIHEVSEKLRAGVRPSERELDAWFKGILDCSNSQAERAVRVLLKGQGEPDKAASGLALLQALVG